MQLAAVVLGGAIGECSNGLEVGMASDIRMTEAGAVHPMLTGRVDGFAAPCVHRHEVQQLPPVDGVELLAGNRHSTVQAFTVTDHTKGVDFWGSQYHPECTAAEIAAFVASCPAIVFDGAAGTNAATTTKEELMGIIKAADTDPVAAESLGTTCTALALVPRAIELVNWLAYVRRKKVDS
jgi:GMP synthase (glutamine-hydrolysing)